MNRKNIFLWALYDFANSIVVVVFFLYFSQWLVVERGVSDIQYNMIFVAGSALLLFTAPVLGVLADHNGTQQRYLAWLTILTVVFLLLTSCTALLSPHRALLAAFWFLVANYCYQFTFVFYNALLEKIAPPGRRGAVSGVGLACSWLGQIVGLLITLPFAAGAVFFFGEPGRAQTFLPSVLLFFLLSLPLLLFFRLPPRPIPAIRMGMREALRAQNRQWKALLRAPGMGRFLLSYFFFNDAIITIETNFPIYAQQVFGMDDRVKSMILLGILVTSALGALLAGWVTDRFGFKRVLTAVLGSWIVILPILGMLESIPLFAAFIVLIGFLYGSVWTVARVAMTALCPADQLHFGFSYYTLAERASTLVGPLAWGVLTSVLLPLGPLRYRFAMISMTVFVGIGLYFLRTIEFGEERGDKNHGLAGAIE